MGELPPHTPAVPGRILGLGQRPGLHFQWSLRVESLQPTGCDLFQKRLLERSRRAGSQMRREAVPLPGFLSCCCSSFVSPPFSSLPSSLPIPVQFNKHHGTQLTETPTVHSCQGELQLWRGGGVPWKPGEAHLSLRNPDPQEGFP